MSSLDPETEDSVALFHPRQDVWSEHFRWSDDSLSLGGITPKGRATIVSLRLNRIGVVNLRRLLMLDENIRPMIESSTYKFGTLIEIPRQVNPSIKLGICNEQGGDPDSVKLCAKLGLTYISCSPKRVPVARLAAAQAAIDAK